jgi:thioredoxin-like negative regulator of GroEL
VATEAPDSVPDAIALAKTAIKFSQPGIAESALSRVEGSAGGSAAYHEALAVLQLNKKNQTAAEQEYAEAVRLDPPNDSYRLALAVLELGSSSDEKKSAARETLRGLMEKRLVRLAAARALLEDAIERKDPKLVALAKAIFDWPEATLRDRIRYVEISAKLGLGGFPGALTQVQDEAALDPLKLTELLSWMSSNHEGLLGIEWARRLPPAALEQRPVFVAVADCFAAVPDCAGLRQWTRKFGWSDLEYLRHAYLALANRSCGEAATADLEWAKALQAANNVEAVMTLQRAAAKWGWKEESVDLLWQIAKDRGQQKAALATLNEYYTGQADTNNLYKVCSRLLQISPNDPSIKNNFAQLSLLLGVNTEAAEAMAKQLHEQSPNDPDFASTYAFALYLRGDSRGALKVMNALPAEALQRPEIAAYYGIILAAGKDRNKAPSFLELGRQAKLLPEERALVEKATDAMSSSLR